MIEERRVIECELAIEERTVGDKKVPVLVGYASVFGKRSVDLGGFTEEVAPGAFAKSIRADDVVALVDHDSSMILGRMSAKTLALSEDATGLRMEIDLPDTSVGRDVAVSVKRGDIRGASFGFRTIADEWNTKGGMAHRTLLEAQLRDVSPVTFPAYPDTSVAMRSLDVWKLANKPIETIGLFLHRQRQAEAIGR
jgi:HK97 family phage prohead protease